MRLNNNPDKKFVTAGTIKTGYKFLSIHPLFLPLNSIKIPISPDSQSGCNEIRFFSFYELFRELIQI